MGASWYKKKLTALNKKRKKKEKEKEKEKEKKDCFTEKGEREKRETEK